MFKEKEHAHELIDRLEPSRIEKAVRVLESKVSEPDAQSGAPKKLRHRQLETEWMIAHAEELRSHRGKWVLIEGSNLLAADFDHHAVWLQAKAAGIEVPFIYRVPPDDLPFAGF